MLRRSHATTAALAILTAAALIGCADDGLDGAIEASGTIEATETDVAAKVPGIVLSVRVTEGMTVSRGDTVALIDHADLDWQLAQAAAGEDLARANLRLALNGPQPEDIAQTRAAVRLAETQVSAAETDLARVERLASTGTAPLKQLDDARARRDGAAAALDMAHATLAKLEAGTRPEQVDAARAGVAQAEARAAGIQQRIDDSVVRAPVSGTVTERLMEPGEMANPGSALVTITSLDDAWLQVFLTEVEVGAIRLGQPVNVFLDAAPNTPMPGRVSHISPTAEFTPKNVQTKQDRVKLVFGVRIALDNSGGVYKPGLPADAAFAGTEVAGDVRGD